MVLDTSMRYDMTCLNRPKTCAGEMAEYDALTCSQMVLAFSGRLWVVNSRRTLSCTHGAKVRVMLPWARSSEASHEFILSCSAGVMLAGSAGTRRVQVPLVVSQRSRDWRYDFI